MDTRSRERAKETKQTIGKERRRGSSSSWATTPPRAIIHGAKTRRTIRYCTRKHNITQLTSSETRRDESADARSVYRYTPHYTTLRERTAQKRESYTSRYSLGGTQGRTRYTDKQTYTTHHGTFTHQRSSTSIILHHIHKTHESDSVTRPSSTTTNTGPTPRRPLPRCN